MEPALIAAIAAGALALLSLAWTVRLSRRLRAVQAGQRLVLGETGERDLVAHAGAMERRVGELAATVAETAERFESAIAHSAVIRYDAMGEMSGRQSSSIALLDSHQNGVVLSSILHREQARLYAKQIVAGRPEFDLSPEEEQAVEMALRG